MTSYTIRPLTWTEKEPEVWTAEAGLLGSYEVTRDSANRRWEWARIAAMAIDRGRHAIQFDTAEEARAAAEAYHADQVAEFLTPLFHEVAAAEQPADEPITIMGPV